MNRHIFGICATFGIFLFVWTGEVDAQRSSQRGSRGSNSQLAATQILQSLDANRNGTLDLSEANGRTRELVRRAGLDANKAHAISTIARALNNKDKKNDKNKAKSKSSDNQIRKVPGFGVDVELLGVKDFSPSGEERMTRAAMMRKFGDSAMAQADRTMSRYDRDKNGLIDPVEQKRTSWTNPSATVSDTNKDGNLSLIELAYRYKKREDDAKKRTARSNRSSSSSSRGRSTSSSSRSPSSSNRYSSRSPGRPSRGSKSSSSRGSALNNKASTSAASAKRFDSTKRDAYRKYAEGLFKNYDKDKDGKLSKKELEEMRRPPKNADKNKDGFVDKNELIEAVTNKSGSPSSSSSSDDLAKEPKNYKRSSSNKSYNSSDSVFGGKDANGDGQLQMVEFTEEWSEELVAEFKEKDFNNDGVITEKEWRK